MADYNTFVVVDCKKKKPILTTSSARKAKAALAAGIRVEVWNGNSLKCNIYFKSKDKLNEYIKLEKKYIGEKQKAAHEKKERRRMRALQRMSAGV